MYENHEKPFIISDKCFEISALACIKMAPDMDRHLGDGSTYITGSGDIGTGTFHINPGYASTSLSCIMLLLTT